MNISDQQNDSTTNSSKDAHDTETSNDDSINVFTKTKNDSSLVSSSNDEIVSRKKKKSPESKCNQKSQNINDTDTSTDNY